MYAVSVRTSQWESQTLELFKYICLLNTKYTKNKVYESGRYKCTHCLMLVNVDFLNINVIL